MSKHTPGPWEVSSVGRHFIVTRFCPVGSKQRPNGGSEQLSNTGRRTAKFRSHSAAWRAANVANVLDDYRAALIAAPDCAAAHASYYTEKLVAHCGLTDCNARAAIAKATGEK